jgi:hypothetical protein
MWMVKGWVRDKEDNYGSAWEDCGSFESYSEAAEEVRNRVEDNDDWYLQFTIEAATADNQEMDMGIVYDEYGVW